jgi:hypothetical protein
MNLLVAILHKVIFEVFPIDNIAVGYSQSYRSTLGYRNYPCILGIQDRHFQKSD